MSHNRSCGSYGPGHLVHWIQAKKSHDGQQPVISVKVIAVRDDGRIELEGEGVSLTLWHHEPRRLHSLRGGRAEWRPRIHLLHVASGMVNLADLDRVVPCVPPIRRRPSETVRQYLDRAMRENHGYTVPQHWLADLDAVPDGDTDNPTPPEKALLRKLTQEFGTTEHHDRRSQ